MHLNSIAGALILFSKKDQPARISCPVAAGRTEAQGLERERGKPVMSNRRKRVIPPEPRIRLL